MIDLYCVDPVTLKRLISRDQWNEPTYTTTAIMAKVDWKTRLVRNLQGEQVVSSALVYLPSSIIDLNHEDKIVIDGIEHAIIMIQRMADFQFSHYEAYIS